MFTRRGFMGVAAALLAPLGICPKRAPPAEWSIHEDADLALARKLLDPFRHRFLLNPDGGKTHWSVHRSRNHCWIVLYADIVDPTNDSGRYLLKTVVFLWQELRNSKSPEIGVRRRLERIDKKPWQDCGLYEMDNPIYEGADDFEYAHTVRG